MPAKIANDADKRSARLNLSVTQETAYRLRMLASTENKSPVDFVIELIDKALAENVELVDALLAANSKYRQKN